MAHDVCPWWLGPLLASPIRKMMHNPRKILSPCVKEGMVVLEPGPGMGFFTLELARLVGPAGRVVAVDIQSRMLAGLARRARRAGLADRIEGRLATGDGLGVSDLAGSVDLVAAIAVVHEMPDAATFFRESAVALKRNGRLLLIEPTGEVEGGLFEAELRAAAEAGLSVLERPAVKGSVTALLGKTVSTDARD